LLYKISTKEVHFKRYIDSIEGKNNASGIKFKDGYLSWLKLKIKPNDEYAKQA
jgi:hypothetical protein